MLAHKKSEHTNIQLCKLFHERIATNYPNHSLIYTDGSKALNGVGAAFFAPAATKMYKLPPYASIFTAELLAIKEAMRYALSTNSLSRILIISDSHSALSSINSRNLAYNYIRQILDLCHIASIKHRIITLFWIPSHIGIGGNDRADYYAKTAIVSGSPNLGENHPTDFNTLLKFTFRSLFQLNWDLINPDNKLWSIKSNVHPALNSQNMSRKDNVIMRRLAIGHTYSTHCYLLKNDQTPTCPSCGSLLTVAHLFEAHHYETIRRKHNIPSNLNTIIETFETNSTNLKRFLREVDFTV